MKIRKINSQQIGPATTWSRRLITASLFGILFFTLFPYWVDFSSTPDGNRNPFTLGGPLQFDGVLHSCLNTLLFFPFGFAIYALTRARRYSWWKSLVLAFSVGWILSYGIEIVQMYMPTRDSAWDDVIANALGSVFGMLLGLGLGDPILRKTSEWESRLVNVLSLRTIGVAASVYFGIWLVASVPLQKETRLNNWDQTPYISIGNDVRGTTPWDGQISRLEIWNKSFDATEAAALSNQSDSALTFDADLLAAYDLSQPPPVPNRARPGPPLVVNRALASRRQSQEMPSGAGPLSLISEHPLYFLPQAVARSNRVTVALDCVSKGGEGSNGTLIAISNLAGKNDFSLEQRGSRLVINLRTGLSGQKSPTDWFIDEFFTPNLKHSLIVSYDGSRGVLFVDGKKDPTTFGLSPGVGLIRLLIRMKTSEFRAYNGVYDSLVFLPLGFLLGLAARTVPRGHALHKAGIIIGIFLPAFALEELLVKISGRPFSFAQLFLSICLIIAGMLWINLDSFKRL